MLSVVHACANRGACRFPRPLKKDTHLRSCLEEVYTIHRVLGLVFTSLQNLDLPSVLLQTRTYVVDQLVLEHVYKDVTEAL